ncbi:alkaline shock response membrane anchor protein AmaP [Aeromicrobium sp. Leaf350]|uniref:alkaline shock response membrane anchor protein AmaP n=1 Tax=Aeromicrobium sp. Leaf350 TaxID=2876565 RepID=UPI001E53C6F4|nr:alkaline shock response membrane anchor protein AmaP [Aeromicrobium sp. Leaf350]
MTTRKTLLIDRLATFVLALVLLAGGATAVWWWSGRSVDGRTLPTTSDTSTVADLVAKDWFGWTAAAVGVVIALVALRWIAAHLTPNTVSRLRLGSSDTTGRLEASASKVVGAAADAYADTLGVRSAKGSVVRDRGQLVARIDATIEPDSDLALLARRADEVSSQLLTVLERDDLRCSLRLKVAARGRTLPRAR